MPRTPITLVPPFMKKREISKPYEPLRNSSLTTASAAARAYKVETGYRYSFSKTLVMVLKRTRGRHIHYGPLSEAVVTDIENRLIKARLEPEQFQHIPWVEDFGGSLLDQGVDSVNSIVETNRARLLGDGVVSSYENAFVLHTAPILLISFLSLGIL